MQQDNHINLGGNLDDALAGRYTLSAQGSIQQAWQLSRQTQGVFGRAMLLVLGLALLVALLVSQQMLAREINPFELAPFQRLVLDLGFTLLFSPLFAGLTMMGIQHSAGEQSRVSQVFYFLPKTLMITLCALLTGMASQLGMMLFILPGLYLLVATTFTLPLVLEKGIPPLRAMLYSIRVVNHQWLQFCLLGLFMGALLALCVFTLGIALIWVGPFYYNLVGLLYRDIFGVRVATLSKGPLQSTAEVDGSFHA